MDPTPPPVPPPPLPVPEPWGFWATIGLGLASFSVYSVAQVAVVAVCMFIASVMREVPVAVSDPMHNGLLLSVTTCLTAPVLLVVTWAFAAMRKGPPMTDYFALHWPARPEVARAVICFLVFLAAADTLTGLLDRPIVPHFMVEAYRTAGFTPLLWFAVVIVAPVTEEMFFRGFLFTGLLRSKAGPVGASVLTSAVWAVIHLQYDWVGILTIFLGGLLLGWVRVWTNSLPLCIALHALMNLVASLQLIGLMRYIGG